MKILIAASGPLGLKSLIEVSSKINLIGIITDFNSTAIIEWAQKNNVKILVGNPRKNNFSEKVFNDFGPFEVLFSINYLYLFDEKFLKLPNVIALNIHGSKLPKYRGRAPHIWAIINGESEVGITVHKIDPSCDTGDILAQEVIQITSITTGGDVLDLYANRYPELILNSINQIKCGSYKLTKQNEMESSYYPKRSPEDGEISWSWTGDKILNWVRALTKPYPGAFSRFENKLICIWKIEFQQMSVKDELIGNIFFEKEITYTFCMNGKIIFLEYDLV